MSVTVSMTLNGKDVSAEVEERTLLVSVLRDRLGYTGTHVGCDTSQCGACVVHVDGVSIKSCSLLAVQANGSEVRTIEGLAENGKLHPMQEAFRDNHGLQCGFCTPGMIMHAYGLLLDNPEPTPDEIVRGMENNLCRCGAHTRIVEAIQTAAKEMKGGQS